MGDMFKENEVLFLRTCQVGRICAIGGDGYPHCVGINYLFHDGKIYAGTSEERAWIKKARSNPKVSFEVDVYERKQGVTDWRGLMVKGKASTIRDRTEKDTIVRLLMEKYPRNKFSLETTIVAVTPTHRYIWGPWDKFPKSTKN